MTEDLRALADDAIASSRAGEDPDYPLVHVAPPVGRLNDPNGLLVDAGTYHAFYQFTPLHGTRRLVYWGHSSSTDLLHWRHRGVAVVPDSPYDASGAYSGSALVLTGAEAGAAPARAPYQLFYTGNLKDPVTDERTASQCLVTSADLDDFAKWPANPLIADHAPGYTAHYRDPQVSRDPERPGAYRMLIGVQRADETGAAVLYRSRDLLTWEPAGEITFPDAGGALDDFGFMWECPGLVTLTDEVTGLERDVLIWCPQGARPAGAEGYENVFPCVYAVGRLVGTELRECDGTVREVDRGFEFYAPQAFARRPGEPGPVLLTGWAGNAGEDDQPSIATGGWVHALTAARALSLRDGRLIQRPAPALPDSAPALGAACSRPAGAAPLPELDGHRSWHLVMGVEELGEGASVGLRIGDDSCFVSLRLRRTAAGPQLVVDRSASRYTGRGARRAVGVPAGAAGRLEVLHDRSITEIFVGDGDLAFTLRSFVAPDSSGAVLVADGPVRLGPVAAVHFD